MNIIIREQFRSFAMRLANGDDNECLTPGEPAELMLQEFKEWLFISQFAWTLTENAETATIVLERFNEVDILTHRTTIECNTADYEAVLQVLNECLALNTR